MFPCPTALQGVGEGAAIIELSVAGAPDGSSMMFPSESEASNIASA
jgi:hypothetical protein